MGDILNVSGDVSLSFSGGSGDFWFWLKIIFYTVTTLIVFGLSKNFINTIGYNLTLLDKCVFVVICMGSSVASCIILWLIHDALGMECNYKWFNKTKEKLNAK